MEAGAELRTAVTVVDVLWEDGRVAGVRTDTGEEIRARIVLDAEGSQGLLAIKAGVREKYPPEVISLADIYDYEFLPHKHRPGAEHPACLEGRPRHPHRLDKDVLPLLLQLDIRALRLQRG